jgi:prevent-host-death family protein
LSTISAAEANRQFSALLRQVDQGEVVTIVSRGRPVAVLSAAGGDEPGRATARQALIDRLSAGLSSKPDGTSAPRDWTRNDLYGDE